MNEGAERRLLKGVALTYDDGPDPHHTPRLLDQLAAEGAAGTFFVTVKEALKHPRLIQRMIQEGHSVGNHGLDHISLPDLPEVWEEQIQYAKEVLEDLTGREVNLFRPPYGDLSDDMLNWCSERGMRTVLWSSEGGDWEDLPAEQIHQQAVEHITEGDIILLHDGRKEHLKTAEVTGLILKTLREQGLAVVKL